MSENIALVKKHQSKFARKASKLKQKIENVSESPKSTTGKKVPASKQKLLQRGIIYVGHIPHGFYEEQMRSYFKQFGRVRNVVICRSQKTDKAKGFGFVQFDDHDVAKIAAETMNNYLMFKRRLTAKYISPEEVKPEMLKPSFWKSDAHKKFVQKRDQIIRKKNSNNVVNNEDFVNKSIQKLNKKQQRLAELGIDYNIPVDGVAATVTKRKISSTNTKATHSNLKKDVKQKDKSVEKITSTNKNAPMVTKTMKAKLVKKTLKK